MSNLNHRARPHRIKRGMATIDDDGCEKDGKRKAGKKQKRKSGRLTVATKLATKATMKKMRPSPKMRVMSLDLCEAFAGKASFTAVRMSTVKSKHME